MRTLKFSSAETAPATCSQVPTRAEREGEVHVDQLWRIRTGSCRVRRLDSENYTSQGSLWWTPLLDDVFPGQQAPHRLRKGRGRF